MTAPWTSLPSSPVGRASGARRQGRTSVGGTCRLLRTDDSWVAINLARTGDLDLLPALTGGAVPPDTGPTASCRTWRRLAAECRQRTSVDLVVSGQELGLPIASLGTGTASGGQSGPAPWVVTTGGAAVDAPVRNPLVVDFSALWAGPICAHILGRCGAGGQGRGSAPTRCVQVRRSGPLRRTASRPSAIGRGLREPARS